MQTNSITTPNTEIITNQAIEAVRNEWYLEDMEDLPEEEMEAELMLWWAGRELA